MAHEDDVLHLWSGLGYYSRARNLHKSAKLIVDQYHGEFPRSVALLIELPGIGRSTAGAIASISMGIRAPIMDGNVKRVLTRFFAIEGWPGQTQVANELWDIAAQLTPQKRVGDYTQVMMDLGATVCKRSKPSCNICPLNDNCISYKTGQETQFPQPKPKKNKPIKSTIMLMVVNQLGEVLLEKRPSTGIWGGLWGFPELPEEQIIEQALKKTGFRLTDYDYWKPFRHTFSHYHLDITPVMAFVEHRSGGTTQKSNGYCWFSLDHPPELGLAAPVKKLLKKIESAL